MSIRRHDRDGDRDINTYLTLSVYSDIPTATSKQLQPGRYLGKVVDMYFLVLSSLAASPAPYSV